MEKNRKNAIVAIILVAVLLISAIIVLKEPSASGQFSATVTDAMGRNVSLSKSPAKMVSCSPDITEIVYDVGLGDKLVGVTDYCDYPSDVVSRKANGTLTSIGGYSTPNVEAIAQLNPDLVLISAGVSAQKEMVTQLEQLNLTVVALYEGTTFQEVFDNIEMVGKIGDSKATSDSLISNMQSHLSWIENKLSSVGSARTIADVVYTDPIYVAGSSTYVQDMINASKGTNVFASQGGWPVISSEGMIAAHPDVVVMDYYNLCSSRRNSKVPDPSGYSRIVTTNMDDSMSIFGGVKKLESVIREKVKDGWKTVFVVTTCASGIIGENVEPVARRIEEEFPGTAVKVINADGNITGEFDDGYLQAFAEIIDLADSEVMANPNMVNLLGERDFFVYNRDRSFEKAEELLGRLDLKVNCRLVSGTKASSIKDLKRGALNIKAQSDQLSERMGAIVQERMGIKTFDLPLPTGLRETERWVTELARWVDRGDTVAEVIDELRAEYRSGLSGVRPVLEGKKVAVYLRFTEDIEWLLDLLQDLGMCILMVGLDKRLASIPHTSPSRYGESVNVHVDLTPNGK